MITRWCILVPRTHNQNNCRVFRSTYGSWETAFFCPEQKTNGGMATRGMPILGETYHTICSTTKPKNAIPIGLVLRWAGLRNTLHHYSSPLG